tara:strand:- start:53 stop:241 length:189 start_codon:yes stop_codon:yes gene_type:complete
MKSKQIYEINKKWRKFRLQTDEQKVQESDIQSIIELISEESLKKLSIEDLENFYSEVKKVLK